MSSFIHLNGGNHSVTPPQALARVQEEQRRYAENPAAGLLRMLDWLHEVQGRVAAHFDARLEDFALRSNVAEPVNERVLGLKLDPQRPQEEPLEMGRVVREAVRAGPGWEPFGFSRDSLQGPLHSSLMPEAWRRLTTMPLQLGVLAATGVQISASLVDGEPCIRLTPGHGLSDSGIREEVERLAGWYP